jgi:RNA polymerase sigma-70 factor (ECF subfamily)
MSESDHFMDDAELVARTLAGDREAFGRLYDRYARLVRAVAFDAGRDPATAQDLTQESFLRAFRQLPTLRARERFGPWVVGIARQVALEFRRRRRPERLGDADPPATDGTAVPADDTDEVEHVLRLVSRLPEQERLAVHFFFLNERGVNETARLLDLSRSGTYALLKRACGRLARWMDVPEPRREAQP